MKRTHICIRPIASFKHPFLFPLRERRAVEGKVQCNRESEAWGLLHGPLLVTDFTRTKAQLPEYSSWALSIFFHVLKYVTNGFLSGPSNPNKMPPLCIQMGKKYIDCSKPCKIQRHRGQTNSRRFLTFVASHLSICLLFREIQWATLNTVGLKILSI